MVTKEAIHDRLWPGTFVSGLTLATVVGEIRTALDDDAGNPRFLRTVHGVGYAFRGEAREEGPTTAPGTTRALSFRLLFEDREIALRPGENLLGRVDEGVVWIESPSVSRRHARERISAPVFLSDGDEIRLGKIRLILRILPVDAATLTDQA